MHASVSHFVCVRIPQLAEMNRCIVLHILAASHPHVDSKLGFSWCATDLTAMLAIRGLLCYLAMH